MDRITNFYTSPREEFTKGLFLFIWKDSEGTIWLGTRKPEVIYKIEPNQTHLKKDFADLMGQHQGSSFR